MRRKLYWLASLDRGKCPMRSFANSAIILRPSQRERAVRVYGPCLGGTLRALRHLDMKFSPSDLADDYDDNPHPYGSKAKSRTTE
jgi:hypothetical protein